MRQLQPEDTPLSADGTASRRTGALPAWLRSALDWMTIAVIMLAILELSARLVLSRPAVLSRIDTRSSAAWRLDWIRRQAAGPSIFYSFDVFHPTRGWALRPNLRDADPYGPASLNSNSAGMRGVTEFSRRPPPDRTRLLLIGDSFTFGEEVADRETFAERLQARLPQTEVLNLGVHGYGHDQMLVALRELGPSYRPDLVIVGFVRDDMERNMLAFRDFAKPRFELVDGELVLRNTPVPSPAEVVAAERYRLRFLDLLDMVSQAVLWRTGVNQRRMEALTAALLDEIATQSAASGATTALVYLPHSEEITDPSLTLDAERFFADYCRGREAACLDLRPAFLEHVRSGVAIKAPGHWHGAGHALAAEELSRYLVESGLVH